MENKIILTKEELDKIIKTTFEAAREGANYPDNDFTYATVNDYLLKLKENGR